MTPQDAPPASLAELIELDIQPRRVWRAEELGAMLLHELSVPLPVALGEFGVASPPGREDPAMRTLTLGALLHHPRPPLEWLARVKDSVKTARHNPQSHLPEDVVAVLYGMTIAAALSRCGQMITSMSPRALRDYLAWAAARPWLDSATRRMLLAGLTAAESGTQAVLGHLTSGQED